MLIYISVIIVIALVLIVFFSFKSFSNRSQAEKYMLLGKIEWLQEECNKLAKQNQDLQNSYQMAVEEKYLAKQNEALAEQKCQAMIEKMKAWEEHRQQSIENAKAAIFEVGHKLSNQLITEHQRESQQQKEEVEKKFKATTESLYKDFSNLTETITSLKDQVTTSQSNTDMVYKALLAPNTTGSLAEITLENILKSLNLIVNVDYIMQFSIIDQENNRLRPDAVIFLPGDNILIIDSKASKFFLELGQVHNELELNEIKDKLKTTMRNHLKSLSSKDYRQAISNHLQNKKINHISTIMFLPTEASIEQLQSIDKNIISDAWQNNIFPAGPMGLVNILTHAKFQISEERKNENYHSIIQEVSSLLYNISNLGNYAKKLGNSVYNSMNLFDKFAASFNASLLTRAKRLEKLGVQVKTNKQMPEMIERYQVISGKKLTMIEGEVLEEENNE